VRAGGLHGHFERAGHADDLLRLPDFDDRPRQSAGIDEDASDGEEDHQHESEQKSHSVIIRVDSPGTRRSGPYA
jgi:hypothetical protein